MEHPVTDLILYFIARVISLSIKCSSLFVIFYPRCNRNLLLQVHFLLSSSLLVVGEKWNELTVEGKLGTREVWFLQLCSALRHRALEVELVPEAGDAEAEARRAITKYLGHLPVAEGAARVHARGAVHRHGHAAAHLRHRGRRQRPRRARARPPRRHRHGRGRGRRLRRGGRDPVPLRVIVA